MAYPGPKVHRIARRRLGRGQFPAAMGVGVTVTSTGTTNMRMTFARPVVVTGTIPSTVATKTIVSQAIVSPTVVDQVWSGNVTGLAYTVPSAANNVKSYQGGDVIGAAGTFA